MMVSDVKQTITRGRIFGNGRHSTRRAQNRRCTQLHLAVLHLAAGTSLLQLLLLPAAVRENHVSRRYREYAV
jgi:hypothetical protein